jgi:hypothetical protein
MKLVDVDASVLAASGRHPLRARPVRAMRERVLLPRV